MGTGTVPDLQSCPVGLINGGGVGKIGLCAMELASLMAGEEITDRPWSVDPQLSSLLRQLNDNYVGSPGERADLIWPMIPQVMETNGLYFPTDLLAERLEMPDTVTDPYELFALYSHDVSDCSLVVNFRKLLHLTKEAIQSFHDWNETSIRCTFRPEEMARLNKFLSENQENPYLKR